MPDEAQEAAPTATDKAVKELSGKLDQVIAQMQRENPGPGAEAAKGHGQSESRTERAQRESDRSRLLRSSRDAVKFGREVDSTHSALEGVLGQHQDFRSEVDLGIIDLATIVTKLQDYASKIGKGDRMTRLGNLVKQLAIIGAIAVLGVVALQPQDLAIWQNALGSERTQFILLAVFVIAAGLYVFTVMSRRRKDKSTQGMI